MLLLDELVVEVSGQRYIGHVWADPGQPRLEGAAPLRWRFAQRGGHVVEFPATTRDTPEAVRARLLARLGA